MKALRYIKLLTATALVALSAASSFSCAESEGPSVVILCETEIVVFPYTAFDSRTLSISVNGADSWDVSEKPDWIAAEREGQLLTLTASENESFRERTGQIVISAGSGRKTIPVTQTGNPGALIHLSPESVSFPGESFVPVAVEVVAMESSLEWTVTSVPDWIDCTRTELKLELTAQPNRAYRERRGEVVVSSQGISRHISVVQSGTTPSFIVRQVGNMPAMAVSPNGRYVVGWGGNRSFLYDRGTDQTTPIGSGSGEVDPNDISKGRYLAYDVSDTGLIVGAAFLGGDTMPFSLDIDRGEFTWLTLPGDLEGRAPSSGIAWGVSADGTAISGMVSYPRTDFENTQLQNLPVVWQNGSPTVLGHDPEGLGDGDNTRGYAANNISADGSVVAGYLETRFSDRVGCYWTMSDPEKVNLFLLDDPEFYSTYFNETVGKTVPNKYPSINNLSTDGRVITGSIRDNTTNGANMSTPFNYNIETGETNVAADHYSTGTYTTPDGGLVYGLNYERNTYDTFVWKNGVETDMYDWLLNGHGVDISEAAQQLLLQDISQDGRVVVGRNIDANGMSEVVIISL